MAKKKAKKEAPEKAKKSGSMGWIIAAIVVIVIVAFLLLKPSKMVQTPTTQPTETAPAAKGTFTTATAPEFNDKCVVPGTPTAPTIGVVPGSQVDNGNVITVTFKNNGKSTIDSTYFEFGDIAGTDPTGKLVYKLNSESVQPGATITYTVDLGVVASELGAAVDTWTMYPTMDGKACKNSRVYVIKTND